MRSSGLQPPRTRANYLNVNLTGIYIFSDVHGINNGEQEFMVDPARPVGQGQFRSRASFDWPMCRLARVIVRLASATARIARSGRGGMR